MTHAENQLLYVADPMCSWCWGFTPVIDTVRKNYLPRIGLRLIMGGLRPGAAAAPLDAHLKTYLREAWATVHARTGQPFARGFFEREGFLYDTEPAARAVVTVRQLQREGEYDYFRALQEAFYACDEDVTQPEVLAGLALPLGVEEKTFLDVYAQASVATLTKKDFQTARELGVQGFPTLLLRLDGKLLTLTQGYRPYDRLEPVIRELLPL
jgi:putative protein-disulfide isomerase